MDIKVKIHLLVCFLMGILVACSSDDAVVEEPYLLLEETSLSFDQDGGTQSFAIKSNTDWFIENDKEWITVNMHAGSGDAIISVTMDATTDFTDRQSNLNITYAGGKTVCMTVIQTGVVMELEVDKDEILLESSAGVETELGIHSNASWTISNKPAWLDLSVSSGEGDAVVKISTNSYNTEEEVRRVTLEVKAGDLTCDVIVSQSNELGQYVVVPSGLTVLSDNVAYTHVFGDGAKSYYEDVFAVDDLDGISDYDLISTLKMGVSKEAPDDLIHFRTSNRILTPQTDYVICTLGLDENGKNSRLVKTYFTTPRESSAVLAKISNLDYFYINNSFKWGWDVKRTSQCKGYYMIVEDDLLSCILLPDVYFAYVINYLKDGLEYHEEDSGWMVNDPASSMGLMVVTWGIDRYTGEFSSAISRETKFRNSSYLVNKRTVTPSTETDGYAPVPRMEDIHIIYKK